MATQHAIGHGLIKSATHDTDPNGGLRSGSLNDKAMPTGGLTAEQMADRKQALTKQIGDEFDNKPADEQAQWQHDPNESPHQSPNGPVQGVAAHGTVAHGTPAQGQGGAAYDSDPGGGLHSGSLNDRATPGDPRQQPNAGDSVAGPAGIQGSASGFADAQRQRTSQPGPVAPSGSLDAFGTTALPDIFGGSQPSAPDSPANTPAQRTAAPAPPVAQTASDPSVTRALRDAATITGDQTGGTGYGKIGQVASPPDPNAPTETSHTTDPSGNTSITTGSGASVYIPASNPQAAQPDEFTATNGTPTGITGGAGNVSQVRQTDGSLGAARYDGPTPPSTTDALLSTGSPAPTNPLAPGSSNSGQDKLTASLGSTSIPGDKGAGGSFAQPAPVFAGGAGKSEGAANPEDDEEEGSSRAFFPIQKSPAPMGKT